jgi:hypothetical protein
MVFLTPWYEPWEEQGYHDARITKDRKKLRQQYKPQLKFCAQVMKYQMQNKWFFILHGPEYSQVWYQKEIKDLGTKCSWDTVFFWEGTKGTPWSEGFLHNLPMSCSLALMGTCPKVRPTRMVQELSYCPIYLHYSSKYLHGH